MTRGIRVPTMVVAAVVSIGIAAAPMALAAPADLTEAEVSALQFNREEERLARDLYQALSDQYDGARPFSRIVRAEQQHFNAIGTLLERYGVADPSIDATPGSYADPDLQAAYNSWYAKGLVSIADAYQVGIELEAQDVIELGQAIESATAADVISTFERLQAGSSNHLAAFERAASGQTGGGAQWGQGQRDLSDQTDQTGQRGQRRGGGRVR